MRSPFKRLKRFTKRVSFKLVTPLIIAALLIAIVTWSLFSIFFEGALQENTVAMQARTTAAIQDSVAAYMQGIANAMYNMAVDKELREAFRSLNADPQDDEAMLYLNVYYLLQNYSYFHSDLVSASIVTRSGATVRYIQSSFYIDHRFAMHGQTAVAEMLAISERVAGTRGIILTYASDSTRPSLIHASLAIRDFFTGEYQGAAIISFDARVISRLIHDPLDTNNNAVYNFLVLDDGALIAHPDYADGTIMPDFSSLAFHGHDGAFDFPDAALIDRHVIPRTTSYLVSVVDQEKLLSGIRQTREVGISIIFAILAVFVVQQLWVLKRHVSSIGKLTMAVDKVQSGDLNVSLDIYSGDEIERLAKAFNSMTSALIQADMEKERQARLLLDSEIKALESQIDSHFISNTLNAISYSAIENGDHHTSRLLKTLASTMRYTLEWAGCPVRVREETIWLSQYLTLQKERMGKVLDYEIITDQKTLNFPIYKLLIQPFVENSIVHGLMSGRQGGRLLVKIRPYQKNHLWISIHDNGRGMSNTEKEKIQALFSRQKATSPRVGIENVTTRIHSYYGTEARMFIRSGAGEGTKIDIILPKPEEITAFEE